MKPIERQAIIEVVNYLADERMHYEDCHDRKEDHIWPQREVLRMMVEDNHMQQFVS